MTKLSALDRAREKYEGKRKRKFASFNTETEADILEYADNMNDFSGWVKQQLREELENKKASE
jgi:predicted ATP-binding protein involved in virulence